MKRLSKTQIKTCIKILEKAKGMVERKEENYICLAIAASNRGNTELVDYLVKWVMRLIHKQAPYANTLERWAAKTGNSSKFHSVKSRIAMIDWMIAELQEELK